MDIKGRAPMFFELRNIIKILRRRMSVNLFKHISLWQPYLEPHPTIYFSNIKCSIKITKYDPLIETLQNQGWRTNPLITITAGVRGTIHKQSIEKLTHPKIPKPSIKNLMKNLHQNVIKYLTYLILNKQKLDNKQTPVPPSTMNMDNYYGPYHTSGMHFEWGPPIGCRGGHATPPTATRVAGIMRGSTEPGEEVPGCGGWHSYPGAGPHVVTFPNILCAHDQLAPASRPSLHAHIAPFFSTTCRAYVAVPPVAD